MSVVLERALDGVATAELSLSLYLSTHSLLGRPDCDYLHVFSPTLHPKTTLNQSPYRDAASWCVFIGAEQKRRCEQHLRVEQIALALPAGLEARLHNATSCVATSIRVS